jgi:nitrate reductase alpha subunit
MTLEEMVNKYTFERQRALIEKQNAESIKSQMYPSREEEIINIPESQILKIQSQIKTNTMTPKQRSEVLSELNIK